MHSETASRQSIYPQQDRDRWITSLRPARNALDPWKPHGFFLEEEPDCSGRIVSSAVILLTNKECPWRCVMCDLWKNTLIDKVPIGAIPAQIQDALGELGWAGIEERARSEGSDSAERKSGLTSSFRRQIKLYNSGSFFDHSAIPVEDYGGIAKQVGFAERVIVESHPLLIGKRALEFQKLLEPDLEVAMGLETAHRETLEKLNKKFDLDDFARAAEFLRNAGIALRVFLLVNPPFIDRGRALEWTVKSAEFAFSCGASVVSLILTRGGNGAMERLALAGEFKRPALRDLEQAFAACLKLRRGRIFADTWNLESFSNCTSCFEQRKHRLGLMNLKQKVLPAIQCRECDRLPQFTERPLD